VDIHVANDGFEAVALVQKNAPLQGCYHLIIMDVQVP
jgi:CheY-like chemotaxis protein